jgi:hypothetical protein
VFGLLESSWTLSIFKILHTVSCEYGVNNSTALTTVSSFKNGEIGKPRVITQYESSVS